MSTDNIKEQIEVLEETAKGLYKKLKDELKDVMDYNGTIEVVEEYVNTVNTQFRAYLEHVRASTETPGRPCPIGQIWCLSRMECTTRAICLAQADSTQEMSGAEQEAS